MNDQGDFASIFESTAKAGTARRASRLEAGQSVEGTILAISGGLVVVDIGSSADATLDFTEVIDQKLKVGDRLQAIVSNPRSDGAILTLSLGRGGGAVSGAALQLAQQSGTPVSGTITASNKGGYTVEISGVRAFCPISQIDSNYVNDPEVYVGQSFDFLITEFKEGGRNIVVSRRRLLEDERRQAEDRLVETIAPGDIVDGVVKATIRHGALIDLSGVEGFVPMAELARARVESAEDVVTVGEKVTAQVLSVERGDHGLNIRLSLRALAPPGEEEEKQAPAKDEILAGKVVKHTGNGVIVATTKGEGLVPTRELALAPGADHRRSYPVDTELRVVVVSRDSRSGKARFSVQKVAQVEERNNFREFHKGSDLKDASSNMGSLGELMAKKLPELTREAAREVARPAPQPTPATKPTPTAKAPAIAAKPIEKSAAPVAPNDPPATSAHADRDGIKRRRK